MPGRPAGRRNEPPPRTDRKPERFNAAPKCHGQPLLRPAKLARMRWLAQPLGAAHRSHLHHRQPRHLNAPPRQHLRDRDPALPQTLRRPQGPPATARSQPPAHQRGRSKRQQQPNRMFGHPLQREFQTKIAVTDSAIRLDGRQGSTSLSVVSPAPGSRAPTRHSVPRQPPSAGLTVAPGTDNLSRRRPPRVAARLTARAGCVVVAPSVSRAVGVDLVCRDECVRRLAFAGYGLGVQVPVRP